MAMVPSLPTNAPFSPEERAWINGYLAGLLCHPNAPLASAPSNTPAPNPNPTSSNTAPPKTQLLLLYGSQTGSAEGLAKQTAKEAKSKGFEVSLLSLNEFVSKPSHPVSRVLIITSTWGDGDPPDNATEFWKWLSASPPPEVARWNYAVLGLGDRNYSDFCGAAKKFDARLAELKAHRLLPLAECDVDYHSTAQAWLSQLWSAFSQVQLNPNPSATISASSSTTTPSRQSAPSPNHALPAQEGLESKGTRDCSPRFDKSHPFPGRLLSNRKLNGPASDKDTRHLEFQIDTAQLPYQAGDALGVLPLNCPVLVEELLACIGCSGDESITIDDSSSISLQQGLLARFVIANPTTALLRELAARSHNPTLLDLLSPGRQSDLVDWCRGRDVVDVLHFCNRPRFAAAEFASLLSPLRPRLYSISSSPLAVPNQVHLTVAVVRYESHGRPKKGVCSTFLAERVPSQSTVPIFVQTSHGFRPPADPSTPMIMVGPGTGIAPFRAFLQERQALGARGSNWLLFGDQKRASDFLYAEELEAWRKDGFLTRLDLAFSRDQERKVYVQDRMREHASTLWSWLEQGAHFYVCGDAKRMAKDVDSALRSILMSTGGLTDDQALDYIKTLKAQHRYQRDVY